MGRKEREAAGYMTLEATFILMLTFAVLLFIFYAGIYQYDKCVIKQNAYLAALRGSREYTENTGVVESLCRKNFEELSKDSYVALVYELQTDYVGAVQKRIRLSLSGNMQIPLKAYENLFPEHGWDIRETVESGCRDPVDLLRFCRRVIKKKQK